jgi:predicted nucleotide-binding protein (sugar kinase/HSP70/actin superfamily)
MQIGRMKDEKAAEEYISERLLEVKEILDDIADQTGIVYLCISGNAAEMFGRFGNLLNETIIRIMKIIPDRVEMANRAMEIAYKANEEAREEAEKEAEKAKTEQGDLFSGREGS